MLSGAALLGSALAPQPASAGVVEWWLERKRQNSGKLIAPIKVAQMRLQRAGEMLEAAATAAGPTSANTMEVLQLVRSSSLNCYIFEALPGDSLETRASLFTATNNISDPCTFRIIIKNVVDFASDEEKQRGSQLLNDIILSYQKLDSELEAVMEGGRGEGTAAADKAAQQLRSTLQLAYDMEAFVKEVLLV